jgi:hypothetical protein
MTLATYYWFSQTPLYNDSVIFFTGGKTLADLPWHHVLRFVMATLSFLMISQVSYPAVPTVGFRSLRQIVGTVIVGGTILGLIILPKQFFFPCLVGYVAYGVIRDFLRGLVDRRHADEPVAADRRAGAVTPAGSTTAGVRGPGYSEYAALAHDLDDETESHDEEPAALASSAAGSSADGQGHRKRRRRRRRRGDRPQPDAPREPGANKPMVEEDGE